MKYEWRKQEKELYGVKTKAVLVDVPKQKFITIKGQGNPNEEDFSNRIYAEKRTKIGVRTRFGLVFCINIYPLNDCRSLPEQDDCKPFRLAFLPISQPIHFRRDGRMFLFRSVLIEIPGNI